MYHAIKKLHEQIKNHIENLRDKQPWDNRKMFEDVERSLTEMLAAFPVPERFAGHPVIGHLELADDPSEHPHKHVVMTTVGNRFNVNVIAHNGIDWTSGWQGYYDMPWERALARFLEQAHRHGQPTSRPRVKGGNGYPTNANGYRDAEMDAAEEAHDI